LSNSTQPTRRPAINRRKFLYATTAMVGGLGAVMATWPLLDQMNPDARVRAAADTVGVDLADLRPGGLRKVLWYGYPIFVVRRTAAMLEAMRDRAFVAQLVDPDSQARQQPSYAKNWHRSIKPAFAVLAGVCTACGTLPTYQAEASDLGMAGGYVCPFCASHYDPAGRAYSGISRYNLPVPPHDYVARFEIVLGMNASDDNFSLASVERI